MDVNYNIGNIANIIVMAYCGNNCIMYININSLCCTLMFYMNTILYVNHSSIKKEENKLHIQDKISQKEFKKVGEIYGQEQTLVPFLTGD